MTAVPAGMIPLGQQRTGRPTVTACSRAGHRADPAGCPAPQGRSWRDEYETRAKLAKSLRAEIDATRTAAYRGTVSLPIEAGEYGRAAVKTVDDRGVESLKIVEVEE